MASELLSLALRAALFASLAVLILLVMRRLLQRWLGAAMVYQAWLLVPIVTLAAVLPGTSSPRLLAVHEELRPVRALVTQATTPAVSGQVDALLLAWACGAAAMALWFAFSHHAFLRKAGRLSRDGEIHLSAGGVGPASVGLFRPRIVVPQDFARRYSPSEQALVIAHERVHIARGDALANLVAALFQCAFWFDPLVHLGARRMRQDQELACDAAVMLHHPGQRRAYAEALLKFHTGAPAAAGLHCHWQSTHPTKERIMQLQQTPPGTVRRFAGRGLLAVLALAACGATVAARADQAASAPRYAVAMALVDANRLLVSLKIQADGFLGQGDGGLSKVLARSGEQFSVESGEWRLNMTVRSAGTPDQVWLEGKLFRNTELVGTPTLLTRVGQAATVRIGEGKQAFSMSMTVSPHS